MLWVKRVLCADALSAGGRDVEAETAVVVPGGSDVPGVRGAARPGPSCFGGVENGGSRCWWRHGVLVKVVCALEGMMGGYFGVDAAFS